MSAHLAPHPTTQKICTTCGNQFLSVKPQTKFCENCGEKKRLPRYEQKSYKDYCKEAGVNINDYMIITD